MIADNPLKAVIITSLAVLLLLPEGILADPVISDNNAHMEKSSDAMQGRMQKMSESHTNESTAGATIVKKTTLPQINAFATSVTMEFIPLDQLFFDHNKAILDQRSTKILDNAAQYILLAGNVDRVIIYGHANSIAGTDYNDHLSDKRANAVKNYLINKKVPAELIRISGWGENDPVDENWTRLGSQRNRRVEIYLVQRGS